MELAFFSSPNNYSIEDEIFFSSKVLNEFLIALKFKDSSKKENIEKRK